MYTRVCVHISHLSCWFRILSCHMSVLIFVVLFCDFNHPPRKFPCVHQRITAVGFGEGYGALESAARDV